MTFDRRKFLAFAGAAGASQLAMPFVRPSWAQTGALRVGLLLPYSGTYAPLGEAITRGLLVRHPGLPAVFLLTLPGPPIIIRRLTIEHSGAGDGNVARSVGVDERGIVVTFHALEPRTHRRQIRLRVRLELQRGAVVEM